MRTQPRNVRSMIMDPIATRIWATWRELRRGPALRRLVRQNLGDVQGLALDVNQADTLELIVANEGLLMGDLARKLGIDNSSATRSIDKLERRGLVQRVRLEENGRYIRVTATPEGRAVLENTMKHREETMRRICSDFSPEDLQTLATMLDRLADSLHREVGLERQQHP